jgi:putative oxygen-independent coproporphyrinogen III oxidase
VLHLSQGIYISVPFCRTKCSFCNFASGVFSRGAFENYVAAVCADIAGSQAMAGELGSVLESSVDSIYLGGGTPSVLAPDQLERIFQAVREEFLVHGDAEITVECAPGTISDQILETLLRCGVNRISLGVQSFVDKECSSVGRLHTREITLNDIARLRSAGVDNISIDLIAGLPHQSVESWDFSLSDALATGVPHVSVYMLEVDEDSRLGTELLAGGSRYHAHFVPDEDLTADLYVQARERLERDGVQQYEISNFARAVIDGTRLRDSRHNLKYWTRQPYLGFGVDAHSMLIAAPALRADGVDALRFATPDSLEEYQQLSAVSYQPSADMRARQLKSSRMLVDKYAALEESFFLGLRLNRGVSLAQLRGEFGEAEIENHAPVIGELAEIGLLELKGDRVRLTSRGRLLSNEVFTRFLRSDKAHERATHLPA